MAEDTIIVFGVPVPSIDPGFLAVVRFHIVVGVACVIAGLVAMFSRKRRGRHSASGTLYYWCLAVLVASATGLSVVRWVENYHLFILGSLFPDRGDGRADSAAAALSPLGQGAYHRHGAVLHSDADRVLRGQRQDPAALERASSNRVLAVARCNRHTAHCARPGETSAGAAH